MPLEAPVMNTVFFAFESGMENLLEKVARDLPHSGAEKPD
jgi:hypothetical protein